MIFLAVCSIFALANQSFSATDLQRLLPQESELGDWKPEGAPQVFRGEDLYDYIDGGAEIYFEYGFHRVLVQDYRKRNGPLISLEVFEMAAPESAYGIYSFKAGLRGDTIELGDETRLADYYLNLWKGHFVLTLTGTQPGEEIRTGLLTMAQSVESRIKEKAVEPGLLSLLPGEGLIPASRKYFRGPLGLYNSYSFFTADVFIFAEAIRGDYQSGYSLYILGYESREESRQRFASARENFRLDPRYNAYEEAAEELISVKDNRRRMIFIQPLERYIIILVGGRSFTQAKEIALRVEENLRRIKS